MVNPTHKGDVDQQEAEVEVEDGVEVGVGVGAKIKTQTATFRTLHPQENQHVWLVSRMTRMYDTAYNTTRSAVPRKRWYARKRDVHYGLTLHRFRG